MLGNTFLIAERVRENKDGTISLDIVAGSPAAESAIRSLSSRQGRSEPIGFAYRNNGLIVRVRDAEATTEGERQVWTIALTPETIHYGGALGDMTYQTQGKTYSPDDLAKLRGGRILLNNPPPVKERRGWSDDFMLESFIRGNNKPVSAEQCIIQDVYQQHKDDPERFLQLARLASIFFLRAGDVVAEILHLSLGPISGGKVHVQFQGRRRRVYDNVEPTIIEIEGDCPLE